MQLSVLVLLGVVLTAPVQVLGFFRVCYYTNWAQYRPAPMKFLPSDIEPSLCSHLIYAFASMSGNQLTNFEWNDLSTDWSVGMYEHFNNIKHEFPHIKTLLAVGGWNFGTARMTAMLATQQNRREFILSIVDLLREYNFDGFDLDFEYPGNRGSPAGDKHRFTLLCQEMRAHFEEEALTTGRDRLLISVALGAGQGTIDRGYEVQEISTALDFLNVMNYDYHGAWEGGTNNQAPLFGSSQWDTMSVEWTTDYLINKGAAPEKLVIGMPTYGRGWALANANSNSRGAPTRGASTAGRYTREAGILSYYEICSMVQDSSAVNRRDPTTRGPYVALGNQWVGYDNPDSLTEKVQWLRHRGLGGWMIWALDFDDFRGTACGEGAYPLLTALNEATTAPLNYTLPDIPDEGEDTAPGSPAQEQPADVPPSNGGGNNNPPPDQDNPPFRPPTDVTEDAFDAHALCKAEIHGVFTNPDDCRTFIHCAHGKPWIKPCPPDLMWRPTHSWCDYVENVDPQNRC